MQVALCIFELRRTNLFSILVEVPPHLYLQLQRKELMFELDSGHTFEQFRNSLLLLCITRILSFVASNCYRLALLTH